MCKVGQNWNHFSKSWQFIHQNFPSDLRKWITTLCPLIRKLQVFEILKQAQASQWRKQRTSNCSREILLIFHCSEIHRGYLLCWGEYHIYFIECREKNQYFSRVLSTSENADIFTARDEIYLVFAEKKQIIFLFYTQRKYRKHNLTFSLVVSRSIWLLQCVN